MYNLIISGNTDSRVSAAACRLSIDGSFEMLKSAAINRPAFGCIADDRLLFLAEDENGLGTVTLRDGGDLGELAAIALNAPALCHLSYSKSLKTAFGASYRGGEVYSFKVGENSLEPLSAFKQVGDDPAALTRVHYIELEPNEKYLYAANIALDRLFCYKVESGKIITNEKFGFYQLPVGEGPRHFAIDSRTDILYLITEYSNKIIAFKMDYSDGSLALIEEHKMLPDSFVGESTGSSVCIIGGFLYGANRGADVISVFKIAPDGRLEKVANCPCGGNIPRHIAPTRDLKCLAVANQGSGAVVLFEIDSTTGLLGRAVCTVPFESPTYVVDAGGDLGVF